MTLEKRLRRMENRLGTRGPGCRSCAGVRVERWWVRYAEDFAMPGVERTPRPGPIPCGRCGRDTLDLRVLDVRTVDEGVHRAGA